MLWVLFALTVAAAAGLAKWKAQRLSAHLAASVAYGTVEARLPKDWPVSFRLRGTTTQIIAREPGGGRVLAIRTGSGGTQDETMQFLMRSRGMALAMGERDLIHYDEEVSVVGGKGKIIHVIDSEEKPIASMGFVTFGNGRTAMVELRTEDERTEADEQLLYSVTQSLRAKEGAPAQPSPVESPESEGIDL